MTRSVRRYGREKLSGDEGAGRGAPREVDVAPVAGFFRHISMGERIGLTAPAVAERVRKLEAAGVIRGYRAEVDYEVLGFPILSIVRLNAPGRASGVDDTLRAIPEVIEANRVTGSDSHVIRARVRSTGHLEELLQQLWEKGDSTTNIVTSSPVPRRPMNLTTTRAGRPA